MCIYIYIYIYTCFCFSSAEIYAWSLLWSSHCQCIHAGNLAHCCGQATVNGTVGWAIAGTLQLQETLQGYTSSFAAAASSTAGSIRLAISLQDFFAAAKVSLIAP